MPRSAGYLALHHAGAPHSLLQSIPGQIVALVTCVAALALPANARAQATADISANRVPWVTIGVLGASVALAASLHVPDCEWCDRGADASDTLNGFDRSVRRRLLLPKGARRSADTMSHVTMTTLYALPTALLLLPDREWTSERGLQGLDMVLWSLAANSAVTGGVKRLAGRERPLVHFNDLVADPGAEPFSSFPSGHTSAAFASVFAAASACHVLDCGHERRIWLVGLPVAALTGFLRIGADKHYATDVLAGAAIGASLGWITPRLVKRWGSNDEPRVMMAPAVSGSGLGLTVQLNMP